MGQAEKRVCLNCDEAFIPEARNARHQRYCGLEACKAASKRGVRLPGWSAGWRQALRSADAVGLQCADCAAQEDAEFSVSDDGGLRHELARRVDLGGAAGGGGNGNDLMHFRLPPLGSRRRRSPGRDVLDSARERAG